MAKRTLVSIGGGVAAVTAVAWLAFASSAPADRVAPESDRARIPEGLRATDPAPEDPITLALLSGGGVLQPGMAAGDGSVPVAAVASVGAMRAAAELEAAIPSEVLSYLSGGLADDGSLELRRSGEPQRGIPISMTPDASLLGEEFDFPTPSLAPPAAPAFD